MKSIIKLAQVGRRIRRSILHSVRVLRKNQRFGRKLTTQQFKEYQGRIGFAQQAQKELLNVLASRNVFGKPLRDSRPHRIQRMERIFDACTTGVCADLALAS